MTSTANPQVTGDQPIPLAVLIDADNVKPFLVGEILQKVKKLGDPIIQRAYGMTQTFSEKGKWSSVIHEFHIEKHCLQKTTASTKKTSRISH